MQQLVTLSVACEAACAGKAARLQSEKRPAEEEGQVQPDFDYKAAQELIRKYLSQSGNSTPTRKLPEQ